MRLIISLLSYLFLRFYKIWTYVRGKYSIKSFVIELRDLQYVFKKWLLLFSAFGNIIVSTNIVCFLFFQNTVEIARN